MTFWYKAMYIFAVISLAWSPGMNAQIFPAPGGPVTDYDGTFRVDTFRIKVANMPEVLNDSFGLAKVCFTLTHPRVSDLKLELVSPSGASIWLTNRNGYGAERSNGYFHTCLTTTGFNGYIHQAEPPFTGEYFPDGRFEFINNGGETNGDWLLLVRDLRREASGALHIVTLYFSENPMPNKTGKPCSFTETEACSCISDTTQCELLPDLVMLESFTRQQLKEYAWDDPHYPRQLRFAATIANVGDGPMETRGRNEWFCGEEAVDTSMTCPDGSYARQLLYQRIYHLQDSILTWEDVPAGTNYYDDKPGHDHFHVDNWVEFRLLKPLPNGSAKLVAKANKVSYCLFDTGSCNQQDSLCTWQGKLYAEHNLINYGLGKYDSCDPLIQGISVGGYDTYGLLYEGQSIELPPGLPNGDYVLEIEVDPEQRYHEKTRDNNTLRIPITLTLQN